MKRTLIANVCLWIAATAAAQTLITTNTADVTLGGRTGCAGAPETIQVVVNGKDSESFTVYRVGRECRWVGQSQRPFEISPRKAVLSIRAKGARTACRNAIASGLSEAKAAFFFLAGTAFDVSVDAQNSRKQRIGIRYKREVKAEKEGDVACTEEGLLAGRDRVISDVDFEIEDLRVQFNGPNDPGLLVNDPEDPALSALKKAVPVQVDRKQLIDMLQGQASRGKRLAVPYDALPSRKADEATLLGRSDLSHLEIKVP